MYSNDPKQIRNGLVNYIGSSLNATKLEGKAAKQTMIAMLLEEAMVLGIEDDTPDMYCLKPYFRSIKIIFEKRITELNSLPSNSAIKSQIEEYQITINTMTKLINSIN